MLSSVLPWVGPLDAARSLADARAPFAFLYSGERRSHSGRYSYLALYPEAIVSGSDFAALAAKLTADGEPLANAWFGYLGYEMLHGVEQLARETRSHITLPDLWFARFGLVLRFDHAEKSVLCLREPSVALPAWPPRRAESVPAPEVSTLTSPMKRADYFESVERTREAILNGDFYEANITRKFTGEFTAPPDPFALFERLVQASPAAYSALLSTGGAYIISSSPERFLTIEAAGRMEARPIKGTAPVSASPQTLASSAKDRAENLMIVDLMRNDLAQSAHTGSVKTEKLFEISTYATLHHMESTVSGQKRADVSALEAVRRAFPPGSMTGAPKIRAIKWCMEQEKIRRGVYSGALGWFGGDGSCDLSVVIRTLIVEGTRFEFQAGGAIVADSEPQAEWDELITKCRGIAAALQIDRERLEAA